MRAKFTIFFEIWLFSLHSVSIKYYESLKFYASVRLGLIQTYESNLHKRYCPPYMHMQDNIRCSCMFLFQFYLHIYEQAYSDCIWRKCYCDEFERCALSITATQVCDFFLTALNCWQYFWYTLNAYPTWCFAGKKCYLSFCVYGYNNFGINFITCFFAMSVKIL